MKYVRHSLCISATLTNATLTSKYDDGASSPNLNFFVRQPFNITLFGRKVFLFYTAPSNCIGYRKPITKR